CGHYGCGGIKAAMDARHFGLIDHWLQHIVDVKTKYVQELQKLKTIEEKLHLMCELNVHEQVNNICRTSVVQRAWNKGQPLAVHGLVYELSDGLLRVLQSPIRGINQIPSVYRMAF
ncbi:MAG: carbonic anhydrase, partial [Gammaproteobacteria bacterium]